MADPVYVAKNNVFAMTAGAKTVLNILAGANTGVAPVQLSVSFDGVTSSAVPATVELFTSTQATAGTVGASPPAIVQLVGRASTAQVTSAHNYTAEPTVLTVVDSWFVPQFMGLFVIQFPLGQEAGETDFSGGTVKAIGVRVNVTANVNCFCSMRFIQL